jgi:plastocyanin
MLKRTITIGLVLAALGAGLAACGGYGDDSGATTTARTGDAKVSVQDNAFKPSVVKIAVGDTVTFTNDGAIPHTVTATDGAKFDSGTLAPGATFSFTADRAGTVKYVCTFHAGMQGTIEVG